MIGRPVTDLFYKVHCILNTSHFLLPYKLRNLQVLSERYKQYHLDFPDHRCTKQDRFLDYLSKIDVFDGSISCVNSVINKKNVRIWRNEPPDDHNLTVLKSQMVMSGCTVSNDYVKDPYF